MSSKTSEAKVTDIIRDTQMPVTRTTLEWFEALYAAGALRYGPDGDISVEPRVREAVAAMHHVLAGAEVTIEVKRPGDTTFEKLEGLFDRAIDEATVAARLRKDDDGVVPYVP